MVRVARYSPCRSPLWPSLSPLSSGRIGSRCSAHQPNLGPAAHGSPGKLHRIMVRAGHPCLRGRGRGRRTKQGRAIGAATIYSPSPAQRRNLLALMWVLMGIGVYIPRLRRLRATWKIPTGSHGACDSACNDGDAAPRGGLLSAWGAVPDDSDDSVEVEVEHWN